MASVTTPLPLVESVVVTPPPPEELVAAIKEGEVPPIPIKEELKETVPDIKPYHFVFAYGSLICKKSRAMTAPTLAKKEAIPVQVQDVQRIWAKRTKRGMTAMGVRFQPGAKCTGVLLPVTEAELARFDKREMGYDRYQIPLEQVEEVPFLVKKKHYEKMDYQYADVVFAETDDTTATAPPKDTKVEDEPANDGGGAEHKVFVWIYVQRYDCPADEDFPIAQSYVDIIMRGCMGIDKEFARNFIETTKGWSPEEVYGEGNDDDDIEEDSDGEEEEEEIQQQQQRTPKTEYYCKSMVNKEGEGHGNANNDAGNEEGATWVDDREEPIYMRADPVYSEKKADVIDQLLEDHIPEHLDNREPIINDDEEDDGNKL